jgi:hypothetical protein
MPQAYRDIALRDRLLLWGVVVPSGIVLVLSQLL